MTWNTRKIALCGLAVASLSMGMLVLKWLPQIEIVTVLLFVYTFLAGFGVSLWAAVAFVFIEGALYGFFGAWWFAYLLHWPLVSLTAFVCKKLKFGHFECAVAGALVTLLFGFVSTGFESIMYTTPFWARYVLGIPFFSTHIVSNFVIVLLVLPRVKRWKIKYVQSNYDDNINDNGSKGYDDDNDDENNDKY